MMMNWSKSRRSLSVSASAFCWSTNAAELTRRLNKSNINSPQAGEFLHLELNLMAEPADKIRLDKWLWAGRFFKTRSMATDAIEGGHVYLNGDKVKPARPVHLGDMLRIQAAHGEFEVKVIGLADKRGSADMAR